MKDPLTTQCTCGSGKNFRDCCLFAKQRLGENDSFLNYEVPDYTGVTVYFGFDKRFQLTSPFSIDFDKACCYVLQANKYLADQQNHMVSFKILKPGDWFVMADVGEETKYSYKYKTSNDAMDVAKQKFGAIRFLQKPEFI